MSQAMHQIIPAYGGSQTAIQYHYDVSREFYKLWLDETMTYSCALWSADEPHQSLADAQHAKIEYHLKVARVDRATHVLDVGCGWGALADAVSRNPQVQTITGLTLSDDQAEYVKDLRIRNFDVRLETWAKHQPLVKYDSIISVGAFEHFAKPEDSREQKIAVYRDFFSAASRWLAPSGRMSLQTIAYGSMRNEDASEFINNEIFPSADLPRLDEIAAAADGVLEITHVDNHRLHYAKTFETWARNLKRNRAKAVDMVGEDVTERYERYLTQSAIGFYSGKIGLLRIGLRPLNVPLNVIAAA